MRMYLPKDDNFCKAYNTNFLSLNGNRIIYGEAERSKTNSMFWDPQVNI